MTILRSRSTTPRRAGRSTGGGGHRAGGRTTPRRGTLAVRRTITPAAVRRAITPAVRRTVAMALLATVLAGAGALPAGATDDASPDPTALDDPTANPASSGRPSFDAQAADAAAAPMLGIEGKGFGHGRGMGQWGALGYATAWQIPYQVILNHFYGGTVAGLADTGRDVRVRLGKFDDTHVVVASDTGQLQTSVTGDERYQTVLIIPEADGRWTVWAGADCVGSWGWWYVGASTTPVKFWVAGSTPQAQDRSQWFGLCQPDQSIRYYRGVGETVRTTVGTRVVNQLPLEQYVRGVVPREMPASWGDREGPWGGQALAVQAVAARSYGYTEDRAPGYWNTCDSAACQVYGGAAMWSAAGGGRMLEDPRTDQAVAATSGEVRLRPDGSVARTEYSASTGGYTAGGAFPAVVDQGDPLPDNPNYRWSWQVSAKALQDEFPQVGRVTGISVTGRNGLGDWGGRVTEVRIDGTAGTAYTDGDNVNYLLGLGTDWFDVSSVSGSSPSSASGGSGDGSNAANGSGSGSGGFGTR